MLEASVTTNPSLADRIINLTSPNDFNHFTPQSGCKIAIGGGKGGVGKTCLALLLGIFLARHQQKVLLIDADISGPNLHRFFGIKAPDRPLLHFLTNKIDHVGDLQENTPFEFLKCIFNQNGLPPLKDLEKRKKVLFQQLNELDVDVIIFDSSSKMHDLSVEFFLRADYHLLISNSELMSIQQNFNYLKYCTLFQLKQAWQQTTAINFNEFNFQDRFQKNYRLLMQRLLNEVRTSAPDALCAFQEEFKKFKPYLVFNMSHQDAIKKQEMALKLAAKEILDIEIHYLGTLDFVADLRKAIRSKAPLLELEKLLKNWPEFQRLAVNLFQKYPAALERRTFRQTFNRLITPRLPFNTVEKDNQIICSSQCPYWVKCRMRRGGYSCRVEYIGFLCKYAV